MIADTNPMTMTGKIWMTWFARVKPAASFPEIPKRERAKMPPASQIPQNPGTDGIAMKKQTIIITEKISIKDRSIPGEPMAKM
jgi:hypothetical protein